MIQVIAGIIVRDGRVLLTQRTPTRDYPWHWECPGGKVEPGDRTRTRLATHYRTLYRELAEEIGWWDAGTNEPLSPAYRSWGEPHFETIFEESDAGPSRVELSFYVVRPLAQWTPILKDVIGAGWFTLNDMLELELLPGNVRLLQHMLNNGGIPR